MLHPKHRTFFMVALVIASQGMTAAQESWKLQELHYNNPGLVVDLGVGLWAWPLPLDYDGDGDLDLLVACPDKPSNGVFFFENPTQAPGKKMPVFRPGVRLGPAGQNMQVSYVDGVPRILQTCWEYQRDQRTGKFDFGQRKRVHPTANIHGAKVRANMWRYVDFDGDGDQDLIVGVGDWADYGWDSAYDHHGRWQNGRLHGYVYLIRNTGTADEPQYSSTVERLTAGGGDIDVYGWPSPNFVDFDHDGDLDLLCGEFLDGFTYFENIGTRAQPEYASGSRLNDAQGHPLVMDLQMITPTAIDWDGDGDVDLIVGDEDGRVALVENTGRLRRGQPVFLAPQYFQQEADTLKFGALATPYVHDWDGDGDEDILCGNTAGYIGLFENLGRAPNGLPKWAASSLMEVQQGSPDAVSAFRVQAGASGSIQGPAEAKWGYTTLSVADWDGDHDPDIVYNSILARVGWLRNDNGQLHDVVFDSGQREAPPKWYWSNRPAGDALTQWRTTPVAVDFDQDGTMDLVLLDQQGFLTLRRSAGKAERVFVDENDQPLRLNSRSCGRSGRVKLDVVDWDSDGRLDVIVNSENAMWYRNCETRSGKLVLKRIGNLAQRNVAGHTSSPAACDFDNDGRPDLLVGAENGRLYFAAHDDCVSFSDDQLRAAPAQQPAEPKFPGFVREEFIFTKAPFAQCHASTICQTDRGFVAAWFGGTREKNPDVGIWTSYHDGSGWSTPIEAANGIQHADLRYPCWNPVLFQPPGDASTMLFFKVGPSPSTWWGEVMFSYDGGRSFRDRRRLPEKMDGPVRCKPLLLEDGTLLCPSSTEIGGDWRFHMERLTDFQHPELGTSWERTEPEQQPFQVIQPTFLSHPGGRLQALMRSKHEQIAESVSTDGGKTWSELKLIDMPNNNSGIESLTLADGRHLLLYNHTGGLKSRKDGWGKRNILNLAVSQDGQRWQAAATIEKADAGEFSYPAMIQADDGSVHLTYTWKRQRVKHVVIDPAKIEAGADLSLNAWSSEQ